MSFLTPLAFLGALLAIPILLMYMLRLRRREVFVSSNFLWQQVLRDLEANTPWQRLRRNLLLLLQLLILALLVLALARPAQLLPSLSAGRSVVLLDASASMNATDMPGGRSRFDASLDALRDLINALGPGDEMAIVRVADSTQTLIEYSGNAAELLVAANQAQPGRGGADWATALTLAAAGAQGAERFNIFIISDGGVQDRSGLSLRLPETLPQPVYIPMGQSADNLSITALAARDQAGQPTQLYAEVRNDGESDASVSLVLRLDGELWDSARQTVSAGSQRAFVFSVDQSFETLSAELVYDGSVRDYLREDDFAFAVAEVSGPRDVYFVSEEGGLFVEQVLRSLPGLTALRGNPANTSLPQQPYDLYIFNGWLPDALPDGNMLIIQPPRSSSLFTLGDFSEATGDIRLLAPDDPVLAFVDFGTVNLRRLRQIRDVDWARPLITAEGGPLLLLGQQAGRRIALLPFDLRETDLPLQIAWPILMANLLDWFSPASLIEGSSSLRPGETLSLSPTLNATQLRVDLPDGTQRLIDPDGPRVIFTDANQPGLYQVTALAAEEPLQAQPFAVNLFSTGESSIRPAAALDLGGSAASPDAEEQLGLRDYWPWVALAAFLLLLLEWWVYQRRMQVPTIARTLRRSTARP